MRNKSVFEKLLAVSDNGIKYKINFVQKTLAINGKEVELSENLITEEDLRRLNLDNLAPWQIVEELYRRYKISAPSAYKNGNRPYFKANDFEDLDEADIAFGAPRNYAQACLEGYVLVAGLSGQLVWQNDKHWFWQSETDKDLVVLKEWI